MSDVPISREPGVRESSPTGEDEVLPRLLVDYLRCVERCRDLFPDEKDREALIASIQGCVEIMMRGAWPGRPSQIGALPPPPPLSAAPRRKTKPILTLEQRCRLAALHYNHVYDIWGLCTKITSDYKKRWFVQSRITTSSVRPRLLVQSHIWV